MSIATWGLELGYTACIWKMGVASCRDDTEHRKATRPAAVPEHAPAILKATVTQYVPAATTRGKALVRGGDELRVCLHPQTRPGKHAPLGMCSLKPAKRTCYELARAACQRCKALDSSTS